MDTTFLLPGLSERTAAIATVPDDQRANLRAAWKQALKAADGNHATQEETHAAAVAAVAQANPSWNVKAVTLRIVHDTRAPEKWAAI